MLQKLLFFDIAPPFEHSPLPDWEPAQMPPTSRRACRRRYWFPDALSSDVSNGVGPRRIGFRCGRLTGGHVLDGDFGVREDCFPRVLDGTGGGSAGGRRAPP